MPRGYDQLSLTKVPFMRTVQSEIKFHSRSTLFREKSFPPAFDKIALFEPNKGESNLKND